jgi:hypothetical protein
MSEQTPLPPVPAPPPRADVSVGCAVGIGAQLLSLFAISVLGVYLDLGKAAVVPVYLIAFQIGCFASTLASPRRPLAAGLPPLLVLPGLYFAVMWFFKGYAQPGEIWYLMPLPLAALIVLPGLALLATFQWLSPRLGDRWARVVALTPGALVIAVAVWAPWTSPQARPTHGTLSGVIADLQRLAQDMEPGNPQLDVKRRTWFSEVPREFRCGTDRTHFRLTGLKTDPGPAGLTALDLGQDGLSLEVSYTSLTKSANDRGFLHDRSIKPETGPYLSPELLARRGYLRPEFAARFRPAWDGKGQVVCYMAAWQGLGVQCSFRPAGNFRAGKAQMTFTGRYVRPRAAAAGLK